MGKSGNDFNAEKLLLLGHRGSLIGFSKTKSAELLHGLASCLCCAAITNAMSTFGPVLLIFLIWR